MGNGLFPSLPRVNRDAVTLNSEQTLANKTLSSPVLNGSVTGTAVATQAQQETGTATDVLVTSGRQHYHPSAAKAWVRYNQVTPAIGGSYNVSSVTDSGAGVPIVNYTVSFSAAGTYCGVASGGSADANIVSVTTYATGSSTWRTADGAGTPTDTALFSAVLFGDQ